MESPCSKYLLSPKKVIPNMHYLQKKSYLVASIDSSNSCSVSLIMQTNSDLAPIYQKNLCYLHLHPQFQRQHHPQPPLHLHLHPRLHPQPHAQLILSLILSLSLILILISSISIIIISIISIRIALGGRWVAWRSCRSCRGRASRKGAAASGRGSSDNDAPPAALPRAGSRA